MARVTMILWCAAVAACSSSSDVDTGSDTGSDSGSNDQVDSGVDHANPPPDGMHALRVDLAGTGIGEVRFTSDSGELPACKASCTVNVPDGAQVSLALWTPSKPGVWSGDCAAEPCALTMTGDHHVTATFDHDDRELATLIPAQAVRGLAFAADGNLIVADDIGVSECALDGRIVWSTPIAGGVHGVVTDAAGRIYGASGTTSSRRVFALSPAGAPVWSTPVAVAFAGMELEAVVSTVQVSPDGAVVAARTTSGMTVLDDDGAPRFSVAATPDGLAVAPDGTIALATIPDRNARTLTLRRFQPDGAELPAVAPLPGDLQSSLAYDPAGNLAVLTNGLSDAATGYVRANLTTAWTTRTEIDYSFGNQAVAFDAGGNVVTTYFEIADAPGAMVIEQRAPGDGALRWSLHKATTDALTGGEFFVFGMTADHTGRIAVGGVYDFTPWIAVYQMP